MKTAMHFLTGGLFWLGWPLWFVYFRLHPDRSRVIIRTQNQILLVRPWLGPKAWGLPGGGKRSSEELAAAACRELLEEVSITATPEALRALGSRHRRSHGLSYTAHYFVLQLDAAPAIARQWYEIMDAEWFDFETVQTLRIDEDMRIALQQFRSEILV